MFRSLRPLLLVAFTLLQSMAPLLHAHGATDGHGGLHLPAMSQVGGDAGASLQSDDAGHGYAAFTVDSSLEMRELVPPVVRALPVYPAADSQLGYSISLLGDADPGVPPLLTSWRTPLPIAPPRS